MADVKEVLEALESKKLSKEDIRKAVEELCTSYNEAFQEKKYDVASGIEEDMTKLINQYTAQAREDCFNEIKTYDDPMLEAVKRLTFTTIRIKDIKQGDDKIPVRTIEEVEKPIDVLRLHNSVKGGIGADKQWMYKIEKFNMLMTAQKCIDLGQDPKEVYDCMTMQKISKEIDMGKNPTSKTKILATLTGVVQAMIGEEYKPVSHDVNYLMTIFAKKNRKALSVTCANHRYMRNYIMEICHRIVSGESYDVQFKKESK